MKAALRDGLVWFWCAGCETHHAINPKGWTWNGDVNRPTFLPSVLVTCDPQPHRCHSFVRDGQIQYLTDSTHALAGHTVPLDDLP
jgi:hypothetical protein